MTDHPDNGGNDEIVVVLEPEDEYTHVPDDAENYNESMYLNAFDLGLQAGGWFRLGNRVNEGYAEMTVCLYLPDGRVGFIYDRPKIDNNDEMRAGGLTISVVEPFEHLTVEYAGRVCLLDDPSEMADPRTAFRENPMVEAMARYECDGVEGIGMSEFLDQVVDGWPIGVPPANQVVSLGGQWTGVTSSETLVRSHDP